MHMADALLSPAVGTAMCVVSAGAMAYSLAKIKKDDVGEKKLPIMAVSGALVFAAQMINFTIPATGSSGHIGGGILLAAMVGGQPGLLAIAAVLMIQCLFFADGGLLALGCNIFNMGVIPCLLIYPLIFKPILQRGMTKKRIAFASILSVVIGLQLGAFSVVLETLASGITELPFSAFLVMMQPIHLAIGVVEGIVTGAILTFVYTTRREILESSINDKQISQKVSVKKTIAVLAIVTLITGGGLSLFASANPDGLEWAMEKVAGTTELAGNSTIHNSAGKIQEGTAVMPDYDYGNGSKDKGVSGTTVAGIVGSTMTFALAGLTAFIISRFKKRGKDGEYSQQS
ncbi:MAG: energy-coupling factor ABC transporter permease [Anaerovoracaceae bacterium]